MLDKFKGALLGLAVGDALGAAVEFKVKGSFEPLTGYRAGTWAKMGLKAGQWTDDTIMALIMAESIVECGGIDEHDQLKRYLTWVDYGYMSPTGRCFDIGSTTSFYLEAYRQTGEYPPSFFDKNAGGNGGIMRIAPAILLGALRENPTASCAYALRSAKITHPSPDVQKASYLMAKLLFCAVHNGSKVNMKGLVRDAESHIPHLLIEDEGELKPTGYVIDTLRVALWGFFSSKTFEEGVLKVVNLGGDSDTTGAVYGQIAGAFYGVEGIPYKFINALWGNKAITQKATELYDIAIAMGQADV